MQKIQLKDADVGELVLWKHRGPGGETLAEVKEKFEHAGVTYKILVLADNNISYEWPGDMEVWVDR